MLCWNGGEVNPECLAVIRGFLDVVLGGFASIEELPLPFAVRALRFVYAESSLPVVADFADSHT